MAAKPQGKAGRHSHSAIITTDIDASGIPLDKVGRSKVTIKGSARGSEIIVTSDDITSFRAAVNAVLRDLTVVGTVSKRTEA